MKLLYKKIIALSLLTLSATTVKAQTVYELYVKFNGALVIDNQKEKALAIAEQILASAEKLPEKTQTNFYQKVAKLYESKNEPKKAIIYWEKVMAAEPDYYVAHRAAAYLYLQQSNELVNKINLSLHDKKQYLHFTGEYKKVVKNCLYHLEKAQACDPDDASLNYIKPVVHLA